jgi:multidrug efflux pump subunit AcrB
MPWRWSTPCPSCAACRRRARARNGRQGGHDELFSGFIIALGAGVLLIYLVLVLLFGGFLQPLTIMSALPLSLGGALMALLLMQKALGVSAVIGV